MKAIVGIVAVVLLLAVIGWISFSSTDGNPSMEFHSDKAKHDTEEVIKEAEKLIGAAETELEKKSPPASN